MNINPGIDYEVALEILGQSKAPLVNALFREYTKEKPNEKLVAFLEKKKEAIDDLMDDLMDDLSPDDTELVQMILDVKNQFLRGG